MYRYWLSGSGRLLRRSAVVLSVVVLGLASAAAANAHDPDEERSPDTSVGDAQVLAAVQRDLGLSESQAEALLEAAGEAIALEERLRDELGDAYAGSWLHHRTGRLTVAVTDPQAARTAREHGAQARLVNRGKQQLDAIMTDVETAARDADEEGDAGIQEWYVDPQTDQVVVTVQEGHEDAVAELRAEHGDAIRVETTEGVAQPSNHGPNTWLDGGIDYPGCSTGFNVRNASNNRRFFLTAGHCHQLPGTIPVGGTVSSHGKTVGPVRNAWYGPWDDGIVELTNTSGWSHGSFVWTYGSGPPAGSNIVFISGWTNATVGMPVCKSGKTTQLTCGTIQATGVSVTYTNPNGSTTNMTNLVRHNACQRGGDSGGPSFNPTLSGGSWTHLAVATNSGSNNLSNGQCRTPPITYAYPLSITMPVVSSLYGAQLW